MSTAVTAPIGVLLMTFGSAVTAKDVPAYLRSVRGGSDASEELIAEFRRRFQRIGRSPLIDITRAQGEALQAELDARHGAERFVVNVGMQHSEPRIQSAVAELCDRGCPELIGVVLAPQYSPLILAGYERAMATARKAFPGTEIRVARAWYDVPAWIDSLAERVTQARATLPPEVAIVVTAHSLPRSVVERDPEYIGQLRATAAALAERLGLDAEAWIFAWQSAGHTPAQWLRPDLAEVLANLGNSGARDALIVPLQFLADHLEVLYDIDVAAQEQATAAGIRMSRIAMPNTSATLIRALADVVDRESLARRLRR